MHPANANFRTSDYLVRHVKASEGLRTKAYFDPAGVPTAGYGHIKGITAAMVREGRTFTAEQCDLWLREDIRIAERAVKSLVEVPLTQNQFDALTDFVFNLGEGNFGRSTLLKKLNGGDYNAVPKELLRWNKARVKGKLVALDGLTIRRQWEARLFATPYEDVKPPADYGMGQPDATVIPSKTTLWDLFLTLLGAIFGALAGPGPKKGGGW